MNAALEFLYSRVYDGALAPEHRDDLAKSGLTEEMITEQFIRSVPLTMLRPLLGFDTPAIHSALLFPFISLEGGFMDLPRVKVFPPLTNAQGHTTKYLQPRRTAPRLYFVRRCLARVREGDEPLYVLEGEKKACAIAQLGVPVVGMCGVQGWHRRGTRALLPDFDGIPLAGRVVRILPDGDVRSNYAVECAVQEFGAALRARGAMPKVVLMPAEEIHRD